MRIGFDFDNTIVSYDSLFHRVAVERSLIPIETAPSKLVVRDYLRSIGNENAWTEMQGHVYGARMEDAAAYPGAIEFIKAASARKIEMVIVSHKTRHPFLGPRHDLHLAARGWVEKFLVHDDAPLLNSDDVYFELTKEEKIARIEATKCDFYIDDLPEILLMPGFPETTGRILFDPEGSHESNSKLGDDVLRFRSWSEIRTFFEGQWKK